MSGYCAGNAGANSLAMLPSGRNNARYSPSLLSPKSVCNGAPGTARVFPEAKTTMNPWAVRLVAGKNQRSWRVGSSVNDHPLRFTVLALVLQSSIQSAYKASSSASVILLSAMNSLMTTWAGAAATPINRPVTQRGPRQLIFISATLSESQVINRPSLHRCQSKRRKARANAGLYEAVWREVSLPAKPFQCARIRAHDPPGSFQI